MGDIKLEISESYLTEVLKDYANTTVGEVMSNIESVTNLEDLKKVVKNTIYQNFRGLSKQIKAFDCGVKFTRPLANSK